MKKGDSYTIGYIYDLYKHNYDTGIINWINDFKYYLNGDVNEFIIKKQINVKFKDNTEITVVQ